MGKLRVLPIDGDIDPIAALEIAKNEDFETVLIIGHCKDGTYFLGGNTGDCERINWLLDRFKWEIQRETQENTRLEDAK